MIVDFESTCPRGRIQDSRMRTPPNINESDEVISKDTDQKPDTIKSAPENTTKKHIPDSNLRVFDCNICEPVVTNCGHLYCWPCLYSWLELSSKRPSCPVCKAYCTQDKVIPIFGRGKDNVDPRTRPKVPKRPHGTSRQAEDISALENLLHMLGYQPLSVTLNSNTNSNTNRNQPLQEDVTGYAGEELSFKSFGSFCLLLLLLPLGTYVGVKILWNLIRASLA